MGTSDKPSASATLGRNKTEKENSQGKENGDLPLGWVRLVDIRETGHMVYTVMTDTGEMLRSQRQLNQYLADKALGPVCLRGEASEVSHCKGEASNQDRVTEKEANVSSRVAGGKEKENVNPQTEESKDSVLEKDSVKEKLKKKSVKKIKKKKKKK